MTKNISISTPFNSYWAVFLTLGCNLKCPFCIQTISGPIPNYDIARSDVWVKFLNSIEGRSKKRFLRRDKVKKLALIGGEPTLHPDFFEIINGLDREWSLTITTNLGTKLFNDIGLFAKRVKRRKRIRFHPSFHGDLTDIKEFISKIKDLQRAGLKINRTFVVSYPPDEINKFKDYQAIFNKHGILLEKQRFCGFHEGVLYPLKGDESESEFKDSIADYPKYKEACGAASKEKIYCKMNKVLFAPDGSIYNCHYKLYSKSVDSYGNLFSKDVQIKIPTDFFLCNDYGFCNPCDFSHAEFKICKKD
jgi:MoaA/NifB/PqqE/SkfB family radical SAM enzyme